jgi:hypothetical protein
MLTRGIEHTDIEEIVNNGEVIQTYPHAKPYPCDLLTGTIKGRTIHVVVAKDYNRKERIIVTVYEPDVDKWDSTFSSRRKRK